MSDLSDEYVRLAVACAHNVKNALQEPVPERQEAAQALNDLIEVVAEYRAQCDSLRIRVEALEAENRRLRRGEPT